MRLLLLIALVQGDAPKRLQQTTYALKAAARGGLVIGVEARDGCIICAASSDAAGPSWASLDKGAAAEKIHKVAPHAAVGVSGLDGDCRSGVKALRNAAVAHWLEFGDRLTLNVDGYYTEVRDFQATIVDSSQTVALRGYLSNIPQVTVSGVEADAVLRPIRDLSLRGSLAYAHGTYARYPQGPCPLELQSSATAACNLTGRPLAGLPRWSFTLGGDYSRPIAALGRGGSAFVHFDSNWRSGYFGDPSLSRFTYITAYNLTNASIGVRFGKGWEVAVFARNLFDANYIQNVTIQAGNSGLILGTPSDPRVVGVTLRLKS